MKIYIFILLTTLSFSYFGLGQVSTTSPPIKIPLHDSQIKTPCVLVKGNVPEIRGFKLGMTKELFSKVAPSKFLGMTVFLDKESFSTKLYMRGKNLTDVPGFKYVDSVEADFYQNELYRLKIVYTPGSAFWGHSEGFAKNISDNLKLPFGAWEHDSFDLDSKMTCSDFSISIQIIRPTIILTDLAPVKSKEDVEKRNIQNRNDSFKP